MLPRRLLWRLIPTYLLLIAVFTAVVLGSLSRSLRASLVEDAQSDALAEARILAARLASGGLDAEGERPDRVAEQHGLPKGLRLTVVDEQGVVLADSLSPSWELENHGNRPEILEAWKGGSGRSERYSQTAGRDLVYAAVLTTLPDGRRVVVRTSSPVAGVEQALRSLFVRVGLAAAAVALVAVGAAWVVSLRLSRSLETLREVAESYAAGDLGRRVPQAGYEEIDAVGGALERMARQLDERLRTIGAQSHEQQAVLSSMSEAVIAVDADGTVLSLNGAAVALLGASGRKVESQPLQAVLRDARIEALVERVLATGETAEEETILRDGSDRRLQVRGSVLRDAASQPIGVVLVFNDVTRLRRLEQVRQEFVANVSHELRTPVTSVKGFLETLRDGALDDRERAEHFLGIASRQADRLHAIIEDLLTLSRLESESGGGALQRKLTRVVQPLEAAVEACSYKADERGVTLELDCPEDLRGELNAALLEQAVLNLIDNAVKFSERGEEVRVQARQADEGLVITVADEGPGIPREHQDRLFERFYRVDRARSRSEGGTGLGLAIVKHIAQAHGGTVSVTSRVGQGSTFTLKLPAS